MIGEIEQFCPGFDACPVQCAEMGKELGLRTMYEIDETMAQALLMGDDNPLDRAAQTLNDIYPEDPALAEEMKTVVRNSAAESLDSRESEIDETVKLRKKLGATCNKPLVLKADANGQHYEVTVCTSPHAYKAGEKHGDTHIERSFEM